MQQPLAIRAALLLAACCAAAVGCRLPQPSPRLTAELPTVSADSRRAHAAETVAEAASDRAAIDADQPSGDIRQVAAQQPVEPDAGDPLEPLPMTAAAESEPPAAPSPGSLSLLEALDHGLAFNPDLVTLRQQENVSRALVGVAETYPFNPILQTRVLPYGRFKRGGDTSVYNYVLFWQTFELARQRRFRTQNAAAALGAARWNIAQAELQNLALTEQLYFTALYQRGLRELAEANLRLNEQLLDVTKRKLKAGAASASDVALVQLDAQSSRQQQRLAEANYQTALEALRQQLNLPLAAPLELEGDLQSYPWRPLRQALAAEGALEPSPTNAAAELEDLAAQLATVRPDVMAAQSGVAAAQANVSLARASRIPNLMAGPFYIRDASGTVNLGLQAQMEVPVANGGRPLVRQRYAELGQQATTHQQLQARAQVEAQMAMRRYRRALELLSQAEADSVEDLPAALQRLEELYRRGEVDVTRAIQARASLLQLRRTHLDSLNEVAQAAAAVTQATGLPPHLLLETVE
jgi:cobalt-zinc-cadmium efflux system outer membrane protein